MRAWIVAIAGAIAIAPSATVAAPTPGGVVARIPGARAAAPVDGRVYAIGTEFSAPEVACALGDAPASELAIANAPGATTLSCGGIGGHPRVELPIIVVPVVVSGELRPVRATVATVLHLAVASVGKLGDALVVRARTRDLVIEGLARTAAGIDVTVRAATAGSFELAVAAGSVVLGHLDVEVIDPPFEGPRPLTLAWFALDLGAHAGVFAPLGDRSTLGRPTTAGDAVDWGPLVGGHAGLYPTRRVGLEIEAAIATTGYVAQGGVSVVAITRAQLAVRAVEAGAVGVRFVAGADLLGELVVRGTSRRIATGGVHYGLAVTVATQQNTWLRVELLDVVLPAFDGGFAHGFELQVGVVTRWGRHDRGW